MKNKLNDYILLLYKIGLISGVANFALIIVQLPPFLN